MCHIYFLLKIHYFFFLLQIVWPPSSLKMLIFLAYCCKSNNTVFLNHLENRHTYTCILAHSTTGNNTFLSVFIKQSNYSDSRKLYWPSFCSSELNPVSLCSGSSGQCPFVVCLAQFHLLWRGRYLYGTGQIITIVWFVLTFG